MNKNPTITKIITLEERLKNIEKKLGIEIERTEDLTNIPEYYTIINKTYIDKYNKLKKYKFKQIYAGILDLKNKILKLNYELNYVDNKKITMDGFIKKIIGKNDNIDMSEIKKIIGINDIIDIKKIKIFNDIFCEPFRKYAMLKELIFRTFLNLIHFNNNQYKSINSDKNFIIEMNKKPNKYSINKKEILGFLTFFGKITKNFDEHFIRLRHTFSHVVPIVYVVKYKFNHFLLYEDSDKLFILKQLRSKLFQIENHILYKIEQGFHALEKNIYCPIFSRRWLARKKMKDLYIKYESDKDNYELLVDTKNNIVFIENGKKKYSLVFFIWLCRLKSNLVNDITFDSGEPSLYNPYMVYVDVFTQNTTFSLYFLNEIDATDLFNSNSISGKNHIIIADYQNISDRFIFDDINFYYNKIISEILNIARQMQTRNQKIYKSKSEIKSIIILYQ